MPQTTSWAAVALAAVLLAGCTGPMKSKATEGIAYDCGGAGKAYVRFGDGGYLPGQTALAKDDVHDPGSIPQQRPRTTARLTFNSLEYDLIPESTQGGLRYRSAKPYSGESYLVWSLGSARREERPERWNTPGRALTSEDARVGLRASEDPVDEDKVAGEPLATCRRLGRDPDAAGHAHPAHAEPHDVAQDHDAGQDKGEPEHEEPHDR
jgi:hypothetical protein